MLKYLSIVPAAFFALSVTASAQQPPPGQAPAPGQPPAGAQNQAAQVFQTLDQNTDGNISKQEAKAHPTVDQNFDAADQNGDGQLSQTEFMAAFGGA
jgi:ABC-type transporter MlaC component